MSALAPGAIASHTAVHRGKTIGSRIGGCAESRMSCEKQASRAGLNSQDGTLWLQAFSRRLPMSGNRQPGTAHRLQGLEGRLSDVLVTL